MCGAHRPAPASLPPILGKRGRFCCLLRCISSRGTQCKERLQGTNWSGRSRHERRADGSITRGYRGGEREREMAAAEVVVAVVTLLLGLTSCMAERSVWREEDRRVRGEVTYEQRALVLDGARRMLFAGEMHYPRSTPEVINLAQCS